MNEQELRVVYHYVCLGNSLEEIADSCEHGYPYDYNRANVTECINNNGFATRKVGGRSGKSRGIFPDMTLDEFREHMKDYHGKNGDDFKRKVERDRATGGIQQSTQGYQDDFCNPSSFPVAHSTRNKTRPGTINKANDDDQGTFGLIIIITLVIGVLIFLGSCTSCFSCLGCSNSLSCTSSAGSKSAIENAKGFILPGLGGLPVGEVLDGIDPDGSWTTFRETDPDSLFNTKKTWAHYTGICDEDVIEASFSNKGRMIEFRVSINGKRASLDDLYRIYNTMIK